MNTLMDPVGQRCHFNPSGIFNTPRMCPFNAPRRYYTSVMYTFNTSEGKQNRASLSPASPAAHSHIWAHMNTRLRCQMSLFEGPTSDKRTAENTKSGWWKPVVLQSSRNIYFTRNIYLVTTQHHHCKQNEPLNIFSRHTPGFLKEWDLFILHRCN